MGSSGARNSNTTSCSTGAQDRNNILIALTDGLDEDSSMSFGDSIEALEKSKPSGPQIR